MIVEWKGDLCLADREAVAQLYKVSQMSVRRYCQPVCYDPDAPGSRGLPGIALYDAIRAAEDLKDVAPRPDRTAAALRARRAAETRR